MLDSDWLCLATGLFALEKLRRRMVRQQIGVNAVTRRPLQSSTNKYFEVRYSDSMEFPLFCNREKYKVDNVFSIFYSVVLNNDLNQIVQKFSEHYHDAWASRKFENGWQYGEQWSDTNKTHPRLKPYDKLNDYERERYKEPVRESLKALLAIGWSVEHAEVDVPSTNRSSLRRSSKSQVNQI